MDVLIEIFSELRQREEHVIKSVLRQLLKREPETEDYKLCTKAYYEQDERPDYHLLYKGIELGKVTYVFEGHKITIIFKPHEKYL